MSYVLGTHVPDLGANPNSEICHTFVYRWLVARGRITGNYPDPLINLPQQQAQQILFPVRGQPARAGGAMQVTAGAIIGFWDGGGNLQHSMIAITPTTWFGANNTGCFGTGGGRLQINAVNTIVHGGGNHFGWIGPGNQWQGQYHGLTVTYKLPPMRHF